MENRNGEFIIDKICERLGEKGVRLYDSNIVSCLKNMDKYQISQLVNMGDVSDWKNERINKMLNPEGDTNEE